MSSQAILFLVDEEPRLIEAVMKDGEPDLQWLYDTIDCRLVELIRVPEGDLWVDEEGKLDDSPPNPHATAAFRRRLFPGDYIAGVAVLFPNDVGLFNILIPEGNGE